MRRRDAIGTIGGAAAAAFGGFAAGPFAAAHAAEPAVPRFAYAGCYTRNAPGGSSGRGKAIGISMLSVDPKTGGLGLRGTVPSDNPAFLAMHPNGRVLYALNEIADYQGKGVGSVEAYAIDEETGDLRLINRQALSGPIPAQLTADPSGRLLILALYVGAAYDVVAIQPDGSLGAVVQTIPQTGSGPHERQKAPHPHAVQFDPAGRFLATADLGTDTLQTFGVEGDGLKKVSEVELPAGTGPRHVAFHPDGRWLFTICELSASIRSLPYDSATGKLGAEVASVSTVPADFVGERSTAEILVHPSGKFLYGSNRRFADNPVADSIVAFGIDEAKGTLDLIGYTTEGMGFPRTFTMDPAGRWLYAVNQKGDTIVQFAIDPAKGALAPTGHVLELPTPCGLLFKA
ncbi:MAG TPA: lactonase family protein [Geminicoccaceae bacterium]|nr:lactonase family protein [Geminicoccus sp.]HMU49392.1 lactonase family protein [Geminicoccaceae bacterium]